MAPKYVYLTTPIFYLNAEPHIGHFYTVLATDVLARFWRQQGAHVKFLTGTDEHGAKVAEKAAKKGMDPQTYVDIMVKPFEEMVQYIHATPDDFIRTTEKRHKDGATAFWKNLESKGQIYEGSYAGWYAIRDEAFYDESELVNGIAPTGAPVEWVEEPCYFFRLSHWEKPLLRFYEENRHAIAPESRYNETVSFIQSGLRDLAISRSRLTWGIDVPGHPGHVMYVWIDALTNYINALGYPSVQGDDFQKFWPHSCHIVGKDILRFHTVYWPAFLMAAGITPPQRVFAHGWWTQDGNKISKSLGNAIDPFALIKKYGLDAVRYFFIKSIRFGQDGNFSEEALTICINQELADTFGNLVQRVLSFIQKNTGGTIPESHDPDKDAGYLTCFGQRLLSDLTTLMENQDLHGYVEKIFFALQQGNQYMTNLAPWVLCKGSAEDIKLMNNGLHALTHFLRDAALLLWPLIPDACEKVLSQLGVQGKPSFDDLGAPLSTTISLPAPTPIFQKVEGLEK